jgi:hypothetical protein
MSTLDLQLPEPLDRYLATRSALEGYSSAGEYVVVVLERLRQEDERDEERFRRLAARWKAERLPHSSSTRLTDHPAYQEIVALGRRAIPWLLAEMEREPDHWFRAMKHLAGRNGERRRCNRRMTGQTMSLRVKGSWSGPRGHARRVSG